MNTLAVQRDRSVVPQFAAQVQVQTNALPSTPSPATLRTTALGQQPASDDYSLLCKVVLADRRRHMLRVTALVAVASMYFATFDPSKPFASLFQFSAIGFGFVAIIGTAPIFILRSRTLTMSSPPSLTLFDSLGLLLQPSASFVFLYHLVGAAFSLALYLGCATHLSDASRLGLTFVHKGRDALQLNERFVFLAIQHTILAAVASILHIIQHKSQIHFDQASHQSIPERLSARATKRLPTLFVQVIALDVIFYFGYMLLRMRALRFSVVYLASNWTRQYLYSFFKENATISLSLPLRAIASSLLTATMWEMAHICFEVYATQPMLVSHFASNVNQSLLSGLASPDPYFQHFAYLELRTLSANDAARRKGIFMDTKTEGGVGGAWQALSRECLKSIGTELQRAKGRGVIQPPQETSVPPSPRPSTASPSSPVSKENVFRPTEKSLLDKLLTPARAPGSPAAASSALAAPSSSVNQRSPFGSDASAGTAVSGTSAPVIPPTETISPPFATRVLRQFPVEWQSPAVTGLLGRNPRVLVESCVGNTRIAVWATQALSDLVCASLEEDPYGVAQRDIPRILEAFVRYLAALENLAVALRLDASELERAGLRTQIEEQIVPVTEALKESTRSVLIRFAPFLDSFKFPPSIASQLDCLINGNEGP
ncbi:nucleoporin NDC1, partial [Phenoliferia sp. Uapishka_3]